MTKMTRETLIDDLDRLGVRQGDCVMLHSSLSSLGRVEGGAETVVEADDLVETAVIATASDLDSWLARIRDKLAGLLKDGKRVKVTGSGKGV